MDNPNLTLGGTATDDIGVQSVRVRVFDNDTGRYLQGNGQMASGYNQVNATLDTPNATSTAWSLPIVLPTGGDYSITAYAFDTAGQQDPSTSGATARYKYYPGDAPPTFEANLGQPVDGTTFTEGRIIVSGRAIDDISIARVEVGIVDSAGRYMSSSGSFTSTNPSWRSAFLNSPGSPGSNFSYTTPVIPEGIYTVLVRPTDHHDQVGETRTSVGVEVTIPANDPPVANATVSCDENVCSFDGRSSTDESPSSLTYSWNFGPNQGTASGPVPTRIYNQPGTYTPTLTVRDEWNASSEVFTLPAITITEPSGNVAPTAQIAFNCIGLDLRDEQHRQCRPERRRHDLATLGLRGRDNEHVNLALTYVCEPGFVHAHADRDRRLGQGHDRHTTTGGVTLTVNAGWSHRAALSRNVTIP